MLCQMARDDGARNFVSSSGGNAGYAAAYAGRKLGVPTTVFVPTSTPLPIRQQIESQGAEVRVVGEVWDATHEAAVEFARSVDALYISPFDHPLIWQGHSTLVEEVIEEVGVPDAFVVSVGGGGLLCGVIEGLRRHASPIPPVVAVETEGTASLAASLAAGKLVALDRITGLAKSLGARVVAQKALDWSMEHAVRSVVVSDADAISACVRFADHHRCLVEPACGASLAVAYQRHAALAQKQRIVVVVCGGIGVTLGSLQEWRNGIGIGIA